MKQSYKWTLSSLIKFECISLYGRTFLQHALHLDKNRKNYLNLGCGLNFIESHKTQLGGGQ